MIEPKEFERISALLLNRANNIISHAKLVELKEIEKNGGSSHPVTLSAIASQLVLLSNSEIKKAWDSLSQEERLMLNSTSKSVSEEIKRRYQ